MTLKVSRLEALLQRYDALHIVLVGDLFLDRWYDVDYTLDEPSLETGKLAHQVIKKRSAPGAGGTVLNNLSAMGIGQLEAISIAGRDGDGWELLECLKQRGVDTSRVIVSDEIVTPSYIKPMGPEEGERFDIKNFRPTPRELEDAIIRNLAEAAETADAVILLDQVCEEDCGVITGRVRSAAAEIADQHPNTLFVADSRAFAGKFHNVILKCNNFEAEELAGRRADENVFNLHEVFACMDDLETRTNRPVVITCNKHGIAVRSAGKQQLLPAVRQVGPIDICGAGDASTAGLTTALCAGATMAEAAQIANLASGVTVRKCGETGTASRAEMLALLREQAKNA